MKSVSVIIPCRNEKKFIAQCLDSFIADDYPKELLTVFVCDGLSDDGTTDIINEYSNRHSFIKLITNEQKTTPYALNLGIKASNADVIILFGAHAEILPGFIRYNLNALEKDESVACAGGIIQNIPENKVAEIISYAQASPFGVGNAHFRTGGRFGYVDTVAFGAYKKEVFNEIGYFDEDLVRNQDDDFNFRLIKTGKKIYLSPDVKSKYYVRGSYKKLFKQYYQYGYWKVFVNKKHSTITTIRQLIPMMFVLFVTVGAVFSLIWPLLTKFYLSVWALYLIAAIYFTFKSKAKLTYTIGIIWCFLILHFSYGIGYLEGIWDFYLMGRGPRKSAGSITR